MIYRQKVALVGIDIEFLMIALIIYMGHIFGLHINTMIMITLMEKRFIGINLNGVLSNIRAYQQTSLLLVLMVNAHKIIQISMNQ